MPRIRIFFLMLILGRCLFADLQYNYTYLIRGDASSRVLLFFPIRVYYEASASVNFAVVPGRRGADKFVFAGIDSTGYILRTLGFSGKWLAIIPIHYEYEPAREFAEQKVAEWIKGVPEYSRRIQSVNKYPLKILTCGRSALGFEREKNGVHRNFFNRFETRYIYHPAALKFYSNVYPLMLETLKFFNHPFAPEGDLNKLQDLSQIWTSDGLDFTSTLNDLAALIESIVPKLVTFEQKFRFCLTYRVTRFSDGIIEICGESHPDVGLWRGFMIRDMYRRVVFREADRLLLKDEIFLQLRDAKGKGGYGHLVLRLRDHQEAER